MSKEILFSNKAFQGITEFKKYLNSTILLGLILLLSIILRFYDISTESYWIDEMYTITESQQSIQQLVTSGRLDQPPAYYLPFHLWVQIFNADEVSTRTFSVLAGIGSILLIYLVGRELFNKEIGLISAFLMAISWYQISFSQETRYYSLFEFMALSSFLFFIVAFKSKRILHFVFYIIASILMVYSHADGVFILIVQNIYFIIQIKKNKNQITAWLVSQALILLALLPYLYLIFLGDGGIEGAVASNIGGGPAPSLSDPLRLIYYFMIAPRRDRSWEMMIIIFVIAGALLVAGIWFRVIRYGKRNFIGSACRIVTELREIPELTSNLLLVCCWLVCPIFLPFLISMVIGPIYQNRYMISAAPALYLLLAFGIFNIRKLIPLFFSLGALVVIVVPGLHNYYVTNINEQWREAAQYVMKNAKSDEILVFYAPKTGVGIQQITFDWYYQGNLHGCDISSKLNDSIAISNALTQCIDGHERFWLITPSYHSEPYTHIRSFFLNSDQTTMHIIKEKEFVWTSVYLFELTK
jgi:mannosyltransferase